MKAIAPFLILAILFSCGVSKNKQVQTVQEVKTEQSGGDILDTQRIIGTVRLSEGCGVLIDAKVGESAIVLVPNNLDEKFQKDGMKIKFYFRTSSLPIPKGCIASLRGNVEEVTPLR